MAITETTVEAAGVFFPSNQGTSGSTTTYGTYSVAAGATLVAAGFADPSATGVSVFAWSTSTGQTITNLTTWDGNTNPIIVGVWHNTGASPVSVVLQVSLTYSNNKTIGAIVQVVAGDAGSPTVRASLTGGTGLPQLSAIPAVVGSMMCLYVGQPLATATVSSFVTGSAIDTSPASATHAQTGANALGVGIIHQTATNSQTSSSVTVGAGAPSSANYAVLVEFVPPGGTTWQGVATMAATSGLTVGAFLQEAGAAVLPGTSGLTAAATLTARAVTVLGAQAGLTATPAPIAATAVLPGTSGLSAIARLTGFTTATLPAVSGFAAAPGPIAGNALLAAHSGFAAAVTANLAAEVVLAAGSSLAANVILQAEAAVTLPGTSGLASNAAPAGASASLPAVSGLAAIAGPVALAISLTAISGLSATSGGAAFALLPAASDLAAVAQLAVAAVTVLPGTSSLAAAVFVTYAATAVLASSTGLTATAAAAGTTTPYVPGPAVPPRDGGITHPRNLGTTPPR